VLKAHFVCFDLGIDILWLLHNRCVE